MSGEDVFRREFKFDSPPKDFEELQEHTRKTAQVKITLVSSEEDRKLHSFGVRKIENYTRFG
jgi:hypothetical protein